MHRLVATSFSMAVICSEEVFCGRRWLEDLFFRYLIPATSVVIRAISIIVITNKSLNVSLLLIVLVIVAKVLLVICNTIEYKSE